MNVTVNSWLNVDEDKRVLRQRLVTGLFIMLFITGTVWIGNYGLLFLLLLLNMLGLLEFYNLFQSQAITSRRTGGVLGSTIILTTMHLVLNGRWDGTMLLLVIPIIFLLFVIELYLKSEHPFSNLAFTFLGMLGITVPLVFFDAIAFLPLFNGVYHHQLILGYFLLLWSGDSGAFFIGKTFGRHKLFERLSPGKTWEGSIGGGLCALMVAVLNAQLFQEYSTIQWLVLAVLINITGTFGDLIKSMMKRSLSIKDSGTILPGHGGILDRFDTLLGSAPFAFIYLFLYHHS